MEAIVSENLLNCIVVRGMFSDEYAVKYPTKSVDSMTQVSSFFVPRSEVTHVSTETGIGTVRVRVLREGQNVWAILPTETESIILVNDADLSTI
jgi:hypothetical protein